MPVGTSIYAARGGIATKVVETNTKNCFKRDCIKYNNLIRINHPDGTFAEYAHLKHNGAAVNEGETIKKGQLIGYSGNTGYSDGPHLHFVVFLQHLKERETLETRFKIKQQKKSELLEEGKLYLREF